MFVFYLYSYLYLLLVFVFVCTGEKARWEIVDWTRHGASVVAGHWTIPTVFSRFCSLYSFKFFLLYFLFQGWLQRQVNLPTACFYSGFFKFIWSVDSHEGAGGTWQFQDTKSESQGVSCCCCWPRRGWTTRKLWDFRRKNLTDGPTPPFLSLFGALLQTRAWGFKNVHQIQWHLDPVLRSVLWLCSWFPC